MPEFSSIGWLDSSLVRTNGTQVRVCSKCAALVPYMFTTDHIKWHEGLFDGWEDV